MIRLPDSELDVMKAVWKCSSPMKRNDIDIRNEMSYNTYIILVANYHFTTRKQ